MMQSDEVTLAPNCRVPASGPHSGPSMTRIDALTSVRKAAWAFSPTMVRKYAVPGIAASSKFRVEKAVRLLDGQGPAVLAIGRKVYLIGKMTKPDFRERQECQGSTPGL
jgi:hypothetical protein